MNALISPFRPIVQCNSGQQSRQSRQQSKQSRPMCSCDDDDDMAPECAFLCTLGLGVRSSHKTSKKRRLNAHAHAKKTRTKNKSNKNIST